MDAGDLTTQVWHELGGDPGLLARLTIAGPDHVLPSAFPVTAAAAASVAVATLAASEVWRTRNGPAARVEVDTRHAALACRSERYVQACDVELGDIWDPVAGDYETRDGWIRLHTNVRAHRAAALRALGLAADDGDGGASPGAQPDRAVVAAAVERWPARDLERAVYDAGGCAAVARSVDEWRASQQAAALRTRPLVAVADLDAPAASPGPRLPGAADRPSALRPLDGLRVLDLTRVIAGPVAARFLAAHGAEVLRVDGPATEDLAVLVADTTVGKRSTVLDLRTAEGRTAFEALVDRADVVLCAYRPGALTALGCDPNALARRRPGLVVGTLSAYGGVGPWGQRRGFDSLVQMATGLADEGRLAAGDPGGPPVPLPVQLLDHASGYLLAAGVLRALAQRVGDGRAREARVALARTALWLDGLGRGGSLEVAPVPAERPADLTVELDGPLGRTRHIRCPGTVVGAPPSWASGPVPLGHDTPTWDGS
jgi:hypothetical protein